MAAVVVFERVTGTARPDCPILADVLASAATRLHVDRLVRALPELQNALDEHVRFNEELLPTVFYDDDVTPWFLERLYANDERAIEFARWLEVEFKGADGRSTT